MTSTAPVPGDVFSNRNTLLTTILKDVGAHTGSSCNGDDGSGVIDVENMSPKHLLPSPAALQVLGYILFNEHMARFV